MAKIGFSLNETVRDTLSQMIYVYDKYIETTELKKDDLIDFDVLSFFNFKTIKELNTFLYLESPLEIFGHADLIEDGLMNKFNNFIMDMDYNEEHELEIVSREMDKSIPSTMFFLSKTGCKMKKIRFIDKHIDEWGDNDILITANPIALANKPENKVSVKINAPYNKDVKADYVLDNINDFFKDNQLQNKILNTINNITITKYEEI